MMFRLAVIVVLAIPLTQALAQVPAGSMPAVAGMPSSEPANPLVDPEAGGWHFVDPALWHWLAGSSVIPAEFAEPAKRAKPEAEPVPETVTSLARDVTTVSHQAKVAEIEEGDQPKESEWRRILSKCSKCAFYFADPIQGGWYFSSEAVWLKRSDDDPVFLGNNVDAAGETTEVLTSNDDDFHFQPGPRFTVGYRFHYGDEVELTYTGLQHWTAGRTLLGDPLGGAVLLTSPFLTVDNIVSGFDTGLGYVLSSEFHDAELTYRHSFGAAESHWCPRIEGGIRYIALDEDLELTGVNEFIIPAEESVFVQTSNHLLGAQVGGSVRWLIGKALTVDAGGKGGMYMNFAHQDLNRQLTMNGSVNHTLSGEANDVVFAAGVDASVMVRYAVKPDVIIRAGYEVLYLSGLALAPEQLEINIGRDLTPNNLNDSGTAGFHGPSVGLEIFWGGPEGKRH